MTGGFHLDDDICRNGRGRVLHLAGFMIKIAVMLQLTGFAMRMMGHTGRRHGGLWLDSASNTRDLWISHNSKNQKNGHDMLAFIFHLINCRNFPNILLFFVTSFSMMYVTIQSRIEN